MIYIENATLFALLLYKKFANCKQIRSFGVNLGMIQSSGQQSYGSHSIQVTKLLFIEDTLTLQQSQRMTHPSSLPRHYQILVVEENNYLRHLLRVSLEQAAYTVVTIRNAHEVVDILQQHTIDLLLIDLLFPNMDGYMAIEQVRLQSNVPIIVISSFSDPDRLAECLALGADEYIIKPFTFSVMLAYVEAQLRRVAINGGNASNYWPPKKPFELDESRQEIIIEGRIERLTPLEYRFLQYMLRRPNLVVSAETLMQEVWETDCLSKTLVSSMVRRLRHKIEREPSEPQYLQTVWGRGYRLALS